MKTWIVDGEAVTADSNFADHGILVFCIGNRVVKSFANWKSCVSKAKGQPDIGDGYWTPAERLADDISVRAFLPEKPRP